jgi:hypothetical protein
LQVRVLSPLLGERPRNRARAPRSKRQIGAFILRRSKLTRDGTITTAWVTLNLSVRNRVA